MKTHDDYARQFQLLGYKFSMNEMDDSVEANGERLNDGLVAEIESKMRDAGFAVNNCARAWTYEARKAKYHPLRNYFNRLNWNGQDHFGELMKCFDFADPDWGKIVHWRFLHGVVGKVLDQAQNFTMVLDGKQGIGKSWYCDWLCPLPDFFVEGTLNPDSNDTKLRIISNLIWEVGELQYTTRKADIEALKNVISQKKITVRPPYAKKDISKPVTCSFIGTINENGAGFLNDPTGTRRFAVIKINALDWHKYLQVNRNELWAQIVATYKAGETGYLTLDERLKQEKINSGYTLISSTHELLLKFYEIDPIKYPNDWIPSANILLRLHEIGMTGNQRAAQMEVATIMESLGIDKSSSSAVTGWGRMTCYRGVRAI